MMAPLQPKKRSRLRLWVGKKYFTLRRYALWYSRKFHFARQKQSSLLPYAHFTHQTPLLRQLKDVDMQYQYQKIINLRLAAPKLHGILLRPGETFSYWRLIGKPTARKGYMPGMALFCGHYHAGIGGGLCQLSNLIFWMTLHTPLTVIERYRHSYDMFPDANRTQPFGSGATCIYPYQDLMIRNDTPDTWQLCVQVGADMLMGSWQCDSPPQGWYKVIEREHHMDSEPWGGFSRHNILYRQHFSADGLLLDETYITENHALMMYSPFLPETTLSV